MKTDPETERRALPRTNAKHWIGVAAEDIPPGWMDDMVKRLFDELNRQMIRAERASIHEPDLKKNEIESDEQLEVREKRARVLVRLRGELERLTRMEMERASLRATKKTRTRTETRADIRRDVLAAVESARTRNGTGDPQ
jgi:hypothetical protein